MNHFVFGLKASEYKDMEASGFQGLSFASGTTNRWDLASSGSRLSLYLADKGAYAAQVEVTGPAQAGSPAGKVPVRKIVSVPEKDMVGWKSMQDNLDYLRPFPAASWGEGAAGQLRKISDKDSKVILRSLEMVLTCPKPEKPAPAAKPTV